MNKDELLYHYFSNSLTKEQELIFNKLLKEDEEFKKQFEFELDLKRAVKERRHQNLKSKLQGFESDFKAKKPQKKSYFTHLKIAASIIVLFTAGWFGYHSFFGLNYSELYKENYTRYPNTVYTITRSDEHNSVEREAFVAYERGNYDLAIEKLDNIETKPYSNFYKAQSYLGLNQYEEAKKLFKVVIDRNKQFTAESHWYLALIYIYEKDKLNATNYLNILIKRFNYKKEKARKLLSRLE